MSEDGNRGGRLTGLQRAFIDAWFGEAKFNGTEAARIAGYSGDDNALAVIASRNLRNAKIETEIKARWAAHGATAEEIISRFAAWARFDITDVFDEHGIIDWDRVKEYGNCIKKVKWEKGSKLEVEAHDQMRAAELVGKTMRLFVDRQEVDVRITDVDAAIERELARVADSRQAEDAGAAEGAERGE